MKPLGGHAYSSIPHLLGSRVTPGDHHCHEGQKRIATEKKRDRHDNVIAEVKLDGSCVAVYRTPDDTILALIRAGYLAQTSKYEQHQWFALWVREREDHFRRVLLPNEHLAGEWLAQAHGTRYRLPHEPFVAFDLFTEQPTKINGQTRRRVPRRIFWDRVSKTFPTPYVLHQGDAFSLDAAINNIETPRHGELDPVEGVVWRVERNHEVDFLVKYVRPSKQDGIYLPEVSGKEPVWNWRPQRA